MEDEDTYCAKYIQLVLVGMGRKSRQHNYIFLSMKFVYWYDCLPVQAGSAVCIWRNILVVHFFTYIYYIVNLCI